MKTVHYLLALAACATVTVGGIAVLNAQDKPAAVTAAPGADAPAAAAAAPIDNMGFASLDERMSYAIGFEQADRAKQDPARKIEADAFLKGYKDGLAGQNTSYANGLIMGSELKANKDASEKEGMFSISTDAFGNGLSASLKGEPGRLTKEQRLATFKDFQEKMAKIQADKQAVEQKKQEEAQKKKDAKIAALAPTAKADGEKYLAENAKKEGWKTTASGLQYRIVKAGEAVHPAKTDTVQVNYEGHFTEGTTFDSSYERGQPAAFPLDGVIPAWTEAVQLIGKGGKIEIAAPYNIAYGKDGRSGIPPFAALCFTIELLDFRPAQAATPAGGFGE